MPKVLRFDLGVMKSPKMTPQGYLKADALATRSGIFLYLKQDGSIQRELRRPEQVFDEESIDSMRALAVTNDHPPEMLSSGNTKKFQVGHTGEKVDRLDDFMKVPLVITDSDSIAAVKAGKRQLSGGYTCDVDMTPGVYDGQEYDAEQKNIRYNHLAIVDRGRAGPLAQIKMDSSSEWATLKIEGALMVLDAEDPGLRTALEEIRDDEVKELEKKDGAENKSVPRLNSQGQLADESPNKGELFMVKITIDGIEYQLDEKYAGLAKEIQMQGNELKKAKDEIAALKADSAAKDEKLSAAKADADKAQGKMDALTADLEAAKASKMSEKEMAVIVKDRLDAIEFAKKIGVETKEDDETVAIKKAIVQKCYPNVKADSSKEYFDGMYDSLVSTTSDSRNSDFEKALGNRVDSDVTAKDDKKLKADHADLMRDAWKRKE